jgi:hypothetical protein
MTNDNFFVYLQNRLIQTSQTGGQRYSDTSPFSIPCVSLSLSMVAAVKSFSVQAGTVVKPIFSDILSTLWLNSFFKLSRKV